MQIEDYDPHALETGSFDFLVSFHKPDTETQGLRVKSIYPRRGPASGDDSDDDGRYQIENDPWFDTLPTYEDPTFVGLSVDGGACAATCDDWMMG